MNLNQINFSRLVTLKMAQSAAAMAVVTIAMSGFADAHHPDRENHPVTPRIDLIGPIGNRLPPGHRRIYNRPSYLQGKIAYHIAPSSQEAMAWHRAMHADAYKSPKKHLRLEQHYFYPKPWEALTVGPRRSKTETAEPMLSAPAAETMESELPNLSEPLELSEPSAAGLPEPVAEPELELPKIELDEESVSPSDAVKPPALEDPDLSKSETSDFAPGKNVETAAGKRDGSQVSRASDVSKAVELEVASKPVFFRRWLTR